MPFGCRVVGVSCGGVVLRVQPELDISSVRVAVRIVERIHIVREFVAEA